MSRTRKVSAMLQGIHQRAALRVPISFQPNNGSLALFSSSATSNPAQGFGAIEEGVGLGEMVKERVKNTTDAAKDAAQNIKDKVAGENHGNSPQHEQPTDSSVEDLRKRPGGYS